MYGLECRQEGRPILSARQVDVGFDILSLKDRKIRIKNIRFRHSYLNLAQPASLGVFLKEELWKIKMPLDFFDTVYFSGSDMDLSDAVLADIKGYFSLIKGSVIVSRGEINLKKIHVPAFSEADIFLGSPFYKPFDFLFEGEAAGDNFVISRFDLSNPVLKFTGKGSISDLNKKAEVDIGINFLNIMLDDFPVLNQDHVSTRGLIDADLKVSGTAEDLRATMNLKVTNAEAVFYDSLFLTKINGKIVVGYDHAVGQNFSIYINNIPFSANFALTQEAYPHLFLRLASLNKPRAAPSFVLEMEADSVNKELTGALKARMRYLSRAAMNVAGLELEGFRFGYDDELFMGARRLTANLVVEPIGRAQADKEKELTHGVRIDYPFSVFRRDEDGFVLDNIKGICYGGTFEGMINFFTDGPFNVKAEGHLREVDLGEFFSYKAHEPYALSGKLDGDLRFDMNSANMFKGQVFVSEGSIEQNPLLNAVSDFLGVESLKKIDFDELSIFFSGGRGEYSSQIKLESPKVEGSLDGKIMSYDRMDGFLDISLATELLNESKQFKKILAYIRHDEPSVLFSFKISSYINSPRVLWLKNTFKDKLSNLLPERNKRYLQKQVNTMVERMEEE